MGGACSRYGWRRDVYTEFWWGNLEGRDHVEVSGVDGRIIRWIFMKWVWRKELD
jgi:hypothetical protein